MEYSGWTLYDEVILVIKKSLYKYRGYEYPQAYLVNPKDKKQLERAINWGTFKKYLYDDNGNSIKDERGYSKYEEVKPDVHTVKNEGFTVEFLDSAHESSQGGKLSFWNCLVSKDDLKFVIGIDSQLLLHAIKESTFIKGISKETFKFARCSGGVGILHEEMKDYSNAIRDMQSKKESKKGNTSKWQLGKNYMTLTMNDLFIGEVFKPIDITYDYSRRYYGYAGVNKTYLVIKKREKTNDIVTTDPSSFNYKSFKELIDKSRLALNKIDMNSKNWETDLYYLIPSMYSTYSMLHKMPSRKPGDIQIETYDNYYNDLQSLLDEVKEKILEKLTSENIKVNPSRLEHFIVNTKEGLSDIDKRFLRYICSTENLENNLVLIFEDDELKREIFGE